MGANAELIPARPDERFARVFEWYARRLLRSRFAGVHVAHGSADEAKNVAKYDGPVFLLLNHASWWDPIVGFVVGRKLLPGRSGLAPMDASQLRTFRFFTRLGLFGINPDDPASLSAMTSYVSEWMTTHERSTLAITPQGRFTDVREPIRLRPGAAHIAAKLASTGHTPRALALNIEYAFWNDQRPEVFLSITRIREPDVPSTTAWHRALESGLQSGASALARLVIARDPAGFAPLLDQRASGPRINRVYDLMLKLRGRSPEISTAQRQSREPARARGAEAAS